MLRLACLLALATAFLAAPVAAEHAGPWHVAERITGFDESRAGAAGTPGLIGGDGLNVSGNGRYVTVLGAAPKDYPGCARDEFCTLYYRYDRETDTAQPFGIGWDGSFSPSIIFIRPDISHDGQTVLFAENGWYVRDMVTGVAERVDVDTAGGPPSDDTFSGARLSADGRLAAFTSTADDLVAGDDNDCGFGDSCQDVFVRDLDAGETTRVSVASDGTQADDGSIDAAISAGGRYVVFASIASNLTAEGLNTSTSCPTTTVGEYACRQVFRHDRETGETVMVSVNTQGAAPGANSSDPDISGDGRYVSFVSSASDLVGDDFNGFADIFVRDMVTGLTERVSVTSASGEANDSSGDPTISDDGMRVAFASRAHNLDPDGPTDCTPTCRGIFVHERDSRMTYRADVSADGESGDGYASIPTLSGDGDNVVLQSNAGNLLEGTGANYVSEREDTGPPPREIAWGDVNCGGSLDAVDALFNLRFVAALPVNPVRPCPDIGAQVETMAAALLTWGDADCSGSVDAVDALKLLRHVASLPVNQPKGCPGIGATVLIPTTP